jgi:hypothetical protein
VEDQLSAHAADPGDEEKFYRHIAISVSTNRGLSPALVWPEGDETALEGIIAEDGGWAGLVERRPDGTPALRSAGPSAQAMAGQLGSLLDAPVRVNCWDMDVGQKAVEIRPELDIVLLVVRGSCACRVRPIAAEDGVASNASLHVRLRLAEALYIPQRFSYSLMEVHAPCVIAQFMLGE